MESSRSTTIGLVLIMAIFIAWFIMNQPKQKPAPPTPKPVAGDTSSHSPAPQAPVAAAVPQRDTAQLSSVFPRFSGTETFKEIETPLFVARISSHGGAISNWVLKQYKTWDKKPLELVNHTDYHGGDANLQFVASDGKVVNTGDLAFALDPAAVSLSDKDTSDVRMISRLDSGRSIEKILHFHGNQYLLGIDYRLVGLATTVAGYNYTAVLETPLPYAEKRDMDEAATTKSFAGLQGDVEDLDVSKPAEPKSKVLNGQFDFVGSRTQYFVKALMPSNPKAAGAELSGHASLLPDGATYKRFTTGVRIPATHTNNETISLGYYFGPLDYARVKDLGVGLEHSMSYGWSFLVRPISIYALLPLFLWLHGFIANWGLVIIVFSIIVKLVTTPLSAGQMRSMRKMQVLQPKVAELRDKYKEDPKKMNEEMLKLYRTYGVNPAGGCLPMLLQMPILFALYSVLKNTIELRQAPFMSWINDLSVPDTLVNFGGKIPLLGDHLSGLTLLLVATMLLQQLFTVTDPRQKAMAYIMPLIFTFMFNGLPSGLALYYLTFNVMGVAQQLYLTKIKTPPTLESMKVDPKKQKGGGIMSRLQEMEKTQRETRRESYSGKGGKKK